MPAIFVSQSILISSPSTITTTSSSSSNNLQFSSSCNFSKYQICPPQTIHHRRIQSKSSSGRIELTSSEEEWIKKLPDKKKPLYSHSLPCIEAWLKKLGFYQSREDRALWFIEKNGDWHAQLSLDVTDLYIRYLKSGPGNLEKDVERRFSYALSRDDIENAILGGP
ncbi:hypothetical protein C5167_047749 [Papaver somniferum]|uniref:Uncharacterized protein n=1 Tax=Papaver somniferum TaxID=3469 RepID=A0A4Y7LHI9_PAPSO|nr:uncharacterized protein LOC113323591 [Papaver somniferum]RZC84964.1 hypothetical protein C5167_047749 [Papaver somniferum]